MCVHIKLNGQIQKEIIGIVSDTPFTLQSQCNSMFVLAAYAPTDLAMATT
jgi:hypothetical protein